MSRLRNRILKADFWSDGELLRWPREKRMTYAGLFALAEDSGCLEDDCFTWKCLIWMSPLDADVTEEKLGEWRDELVAAGKLIPYVVAGQQYLYLKSFHEHEHPRNPQRPAVPLPPWVDWVPHETNPHKGHYEIHELAAKQPRRAKETSAKKPASDDDGFALFWERYPRKVGKTAAEKRWRTIKVKERDDVVTAAGNLAASSTAKDLKYVPYPATFIGPQRQWEDWVHGAAPGYEGNGKGSTKRPMCPECEMDLTYDEEGAHCPVCGWRPSSRRALR